MRSKSLAHIWRAFPVREGRTIESHLTRPDGSRCPRCGEILEARPGRRAVILECRDCQRFHARSQQTPELLYVMRIQRLATAIRSA